MSFTTHLCVCVCVCDYLRPAGVRRDSLTDLRHTFLPGLRVSSTHDHRLIELQQRWTQTQMHSDEGLFSTITAGTYTDASTQSYLHMSAVYRCRDHVFLVGQHLKTSCISTLSIPTALNSEIRSVFNTRSRCSRFIIHASVKPLVGCLFLFLLVFKISAVLKINATLFKMK